MREIDYQFLTQEFSIGNHPVRKLGKEHRLLYVKGLGEFLCYITRKNWVTNLVFRIWGASIIDQEPQEYWSYSKDFAAIKECMVTHHEGLKIFSMKRSFLFDCFYLLEKSNKDLSAEAYRFFERNICTFVSKMTLDYVNDYLNGRNEGLEISEVLRQHRERTRHFMGKRGKRVLMVATMSAGKSTLINALVGEKICKVLSTACTGALQYIYNKPFDEGGMYYLEDECLLFSRAFPREESESIKSAGLRFKMNPSNEKICLIDTPGVNYNGNKQHGEITRKEIKSNNYEILLLVMNARQLAIDDERDLIDFIGENCKRKIIGVINQCDVLVESQDSISEAIETGKKMMSEAGIKNPIVLPVSAHAAYLDNRHKSGIEGKSLESFEYETMLNKFRNPYYNLPSYVMGKRPEIEWDLAEKSGVKGLFRLIEKL